MYAAKIKDTDQTVQAYLCISCSSKYHGISQKQVAPIYTNAASHNVTQ